jgi:Bax protein
MKQFRLKQVFSLAGILMLFFIIDGCGRKKTLRVKTETINVDSLEQIVLLDSILVRPFLYTRVAGLGRLPVPKAKAKFISAVLPSILVAKYRIEENKKKLLLLKEAEEWDSADSSFFLDMKKRYRAKNIDDVIMRMGTLPNSIVLAQAAVESGWGQSRFFLQGSNLFGVWSFNQFEPRIAAGKTRNKKKIYLRSYEDMSASVVHYFEILSHARPYNNLRRARLETTDPFKLLPHLQNFSERRTAYTDQLKKIILRNNLTRYDQYQIDPAYIVEE